VTATKERHTLTLDAEIVGALGSENLSGQVNQILREEIARRRAQVALAELLESLETEFGPADPTLVEEYRQALR
jgi:hypothetical protein